MDELLKQLPNLVTTVGVPTAMFIAFLVLLWKKILYTSATVEALNTHTDFVLTEKNAQLDAERKQKELAEFTTQQALSTMNEVLRLTHGVVLQAVRDASEQPAEPEPTQRRRVSPPALDAASGKVSARSGRRA